MLNEDTVLLPRPLMCMHGDFLLYPRSRSDRNVPGSNVTGPKACAVGVYMCMPKIRLIKSNLKLWIGLPPRALSVSMTTAKARKVTTKSKHSIPKPAAKHARRKTVTENDIDMENIVHNLQGMDSVASGGSVAPS